MKLTPILASVAVALAIGPAAASGARPVYVSDYGTANLVSVFSTGAGGDLLVPPASVGSGSAEATAFTPDGKYLYVGNNNTGVSGFSVGPGGALTPLAGSPVAAGNSVYAITVTADGKHLYVPNQNSSGAVYGFAIAADGSLTATPGSPYSGANNPYGVAGSPDSRSLYVADSGTNQIRPYDVAADGSLTLKAGGPIPTGDSNPNYVIVTPDGRRVYAGNYTGDSISGFSAGTDGSLAALADSPFSVVTRPYAGMAVNPDGTRLYVSSMDADKVVPLAIASDGTLSSAGTPIDAGDETNGVAITPDGRNVYASAGGSKQVFAFSVQPGGGLAANGLPQALNPLGYSDYQSVAIPPNQGPVATLSAQETNGAVDLDASGSTDADGTVASYAWDFGDGKTETTASPKVTHEYSTNGDYTATVKLTDNEGCSIALIYTGQATLCNGSDEAAAATTISVDAGIEGAKVSAKKTQKQKGKLKIVVKAGASEAVQVAAAGSATFKGVKGKVALKKAKGNAKAGKTKTLKLGAKKKSQGKAVVGSKGSGKIKVTLTDDDGNVLKKSVKVKLK